MRKKTETSRQKNGYGAHLYVSPLWNLSITTPLYYATVFVLDRFVTLALIDVVCILMILFLLVKRKPYRSMIITSLIYCRGVCRRARFWPRNDPGA